MGGSNVMEADDIKLFAKYTGWGEYDNFTTICDSIDRIHSKGMFLKNNPLGFALPLLLLQFSLSSASILLMSYVLRPLRQTAFVAQMLGGIIIGPSGIGQINKFLQLMFPMRSLIILDMLSSIGYMLFFFLTGVDINPMLLKKINRRTFIVGILTPAVPMVLTEAASFFILQFSKTEPHVTRKLPLVAQAESVLALPTVTTLLLELDIANSELGRWASCSSMVSGFFSFTITISVVLAGQSLRDKAVMFTTIFTAIVFTAGIIFVVGPAVVRMLQKERDGGSMKHSQFVVLVLTVLLTGFCSQAVGLHVYYGPFILGITIPRDPPIGSTIIEKLSCVNNSIFLPIFFVKNGLVIDIFKIRMKNFVTVQAIAFVGAVGKFLTAFSTAVYYKMPAVDAVALGLIFTVQGLLELGFFKMLKKDGVIDHDAFMIMCVSMIVLRSCVTPIIKRIYDPTRKYLVYKRRTVSNLKPDTELGILVSLHKEDDVPMAINLLEALNPNLASPLSVAVLHLVELVGLEKRLIIPHNMGEIPFSYEGPTEDIFKAFKYYEQSKLGHASVSAYTAISPSSLMYDDVFTLAFEASTSLTIIPSGRVAMNKSILERAPCSIGVLVNRGLLKPPPRSLLGLGNWSPYRVGVVFLGGDDDREALAIGARMAEHPNITVTMIRFLVSGNVAGIDANERRLDNEFLSHFRLEMSRNTRVTYIEEVIMDGSGTVAVLRSLENSYELVLVGKNHNRQSPMLSGLGDSGEASELGSIGRILDSAKDNTTILVVQQHNNMSRNGNGTVNRKLSIGGTSSSKSREEDEITPIQGRS